MKITKLLNLFVISFVSFFPTSVRGNSWDPNLSADLFVTANTYELIGFVDNAVTMYATIRGNPRPTKDNIVWIKMGDNLPTDRVEITYDTSTNESRLRITDLKYNDAGTYFCQANVQGVSKSVSMTLRVVVEPAVDRVSGLITAKAVGQSAVFSVTVSGNPLPIEENISWAKLDALNLPTIFSDPRWSYADGNKEFTVKDLRISDEGWYKCLVTTNEGKAEVSFTLNVLGMREIQAEGVGVVGNSATLSCVATYFQMLPLAPEIQWYRYEQQTSPLSGATITRSVSDHAVSTITLDNLSWEDEGQYFCKASYTGYPDHSIYNATLHIRGISTPPVRAKGVLGRSTIFQCTARGDVQASFSWTRNDVSVAGESTLLYTAPYTSTVFTYAGVVSDDTSAEFRCIAEFDNQTTSAISDPSSVDVIEVTSPPADVYGVVGTGNSVSLSCQTEGNPDPSSFVWKFKDEIIDSDAVVVSGTRSTLTLSGLTRANEGNYVCIPTYPTEEIFPGGNTTSDSGYLTMIGITAPPVQTIVKVGDTAVFTCKADASPTPTLTWYKGGNPWTIGVSAPQTVSDEVISTLTVDDVGDEDVAPYSCKAEYPSLGTHVSEPANLRFRGIEVPPISTNAVIGLKNQMNCTARGESVASLTWKANGTEITSSENFKIDTFDNHDPSKEQDLIDTRIILSVSEVDLDTTFLKITCSATWVYNGQASVVQSEPVSFVPLYVYESPVNTIAVRYTQVKLTCKATGSPLVRWDRSGRTYGYGLIKQESNSVESTLMLGNVTSADQGRIWCVGLYDQGSHDSDEATLTVVGIIEEPATQYLTQRGQSAQFYCIVDRYPPHTVSWFKDTAQIQGFENRINITQIEADYTVKYLLSVSSVSEDDMDSYFCQVEYEQGTQISQPAQLIIQEPPEITLVVATGGEKEGDSIELLCQATGVPKPIITWRIGGQVFPSEDTTSTVEVFNEPGSSLVLINSTSSADQGVYSCVANNGIGDSVIMETEVNIQASRQLVTVTSATSLIVFIVAVCMALMLFALYRKRKRKRLITDEEKTVPPVVEEHTSVEPHIYDNEAYQVAGGSDMSTPQKIRIYPFRPAKVYSNTD